MANWTPERGEDTSSLRHTAYEIGRPVRDAAAWLFCPGHRPDRFERALASAGVVIIDLEDGVDPTDKPAARHHVATSPALRDPERIVVRVNASGSPDLMEDLRALRATDLRTVMLPRTASPEQVETLEGLEVIALCETAVGVSESRRIGEASNCIGLTWGAEDLRLELGAKGRTADGAFTSTFAAVRSTVRLSAAAAGIPAYDTVWPALDDVAGLAREARAAADAGFLGKLAVHPRQVRPIEDAFSPDPDEVDAARRLLAAASAGTGATALDGQMVDRPIIEAAARLVQRAEAVRRRDRG